MQLFTHISAFRTAQFWHAEAVFVSVSGAAEVVMVLCRFIRLLRVRLTSKSSWMFQIYDVHPQRDLIDA